MIVVVRSKLLRDLCEKVTMRLCDTQIPVISQHSGFYENFQQSAQNFNEETLQAATHKNEGLLVPMKKVVYTYVQINLHR